MPTLMQKVSAVSRITISSEAKESIKAKLAEKILDQSDDKAWEEFDASRKQGVSSKTWGNAEGGYAGYNLALGFTNEYGRTVDQQEFKKRFKEVKDGHASDTKRDDSKDSSLISLFQSSVQDPVAKANSNW